VVNNYHASYNKRGKIVYFYPVLRSRERAAGGRRGSLGDLRATGYGVRREREIERESGRRRAWEATASRESGRSTGYRLRRPEREGDRERERPAACVGGDRRRREDGEVRRRRLGVRTATRRGEE
jgi:hypothetical protein